MRAAGQMNGIAVDAAGNAYVTGATSSTDFPVTPGAFQTTYLGDTNAFVTKLNAAGSALLYSTYFGAGGAVGHAIAVDAAGNAYFTGETLAGLPALHAGQSSFYGGTIFAFTPSGTIALIWLADVMMMGASITTGRAGATAGS